MASSQYPLHKLAEEVARDFSGRLIVGEDLDENQFVTAASIYNWGSI
jgi:hypothetical protein